MVPTPPLPLARKAYRVGPRTPGERTDKTGDLRKAGTAGLQRACNADAVGVAQSGTEGATVQTARGTFPEGTSWRTDDEREGALKFNDLAAQS